MEVDILRFKKILVIFWMFWWGIALWTDVVGGLAHLGVLHVSFAPDLNYPFLQKSLAMYHLPEWLIAVIFMGILLWLALSFFTFVWATLALRLERHIWMRRAERAFIVSLCLWLTFFIADQLIMNFDLEMNHMVQGGFQFMCFLSLYLLPESMSR